MITIKVNISSTDHYLETYENDPINLTYQYSDIEKIQSAVGSFSQTFRIPATDANMNAFGDYTNSNNQGFNAKVKSSAIIFSDTIPILRGFIQLKQTFIVNGRHSEYELVFFGEAVDLARTLGDKKLADLDLSALNHTVNYANVISSWAGTLSSGKIRYGLIGKRNYDNNGAGVEISASNPLYAGDFTPCIRVKSLVEQIFTDNNLILDSDFITNDLDAYYVPLFNGKMLPDGTTSNLDQDFFVGLVSGSTVVAYSGINTRHFITGWSEASPFFDNGNNIASNQFTSPINAQIQFHFNVLLEHTSNTATAPYSTDRSFRIELHDTTDNVLVGNTPPQTISVGSSVALNDTIIVQVEQGHTYEVAILVVGGIASGTMTINSSGLLAGTSTFWRVVNVIETDGSSVNQLYGQTLDTAGNCPDIKQIDFLTSLQKMFNLVFVPDPLIENKIKIATYEDYTSAGTIKDWSDYLDQSKDIIIKPTTDLQKKNYEWSYKADKDYLNEIYAEQGDGVYGRYLIEDGQNDFATGDIKIEPELGAFPLAPIGGTNILIHKAIGENGQLVTDPLCKVVLWGGLITEAGLVVYNDATTSNVTQTQYPYIGHYSTPDATVGSTDLNYGEEIPAHEIQGNPINNLYHTYWANYVNQLYSVEARIMECSMYLTSREIHDFEFSDRIWIKDSYWRVNKIQYPATEKALSKVTLIKILADVRECAQIPVSISAFGVTFANADGTTTINPSQTCCEFYGYVYIGTKCYFKGIRNPRPLNTLGKKPLLLSQSEVKGEVLATGQGITAPLGSSGIVTGKDITLGNDSINVLVTGENHLVGDFKNLLVSGSNVNAFVSGRHHGGGAPTATAKGLAQSGEITFIYDGAYARAQTVEMLIDGIPDNRLSIPNNTSMTVEMHWTVFTVNPASGALEDANGGNLVDLWYKRSGVAQSVNGTNTTLENERAGGLSGSTIQVTVDTTTDTSQHRLTTSNRNVNTRNTRIVCVMRYTMTTL